MKFSSMRLVVGSGPTREWLDPVRFLSNPSTGRMGHAIASAGLGRFREIVFISGPVGSGFQRVSGAVNFSVETTQEMRDRVVESLSNDTILVMAAAPADYAPVETRSTKIKKQQNVNLELTLKPTPDILLEVAQLKSRFTNLIRVGFAAETDNVIENALTKMQKKDLDFICANVVFKEETGFGDHPNSLLVLDRLGAEHTLGPAPKPELARSLLDYLEST
ncbi:MAG: phosphopantothenoylcysteine decarboxylase [Spirochaetia bacterium]|nr:phosphopantothenoylcysteine decarboxylase [Spirochaetia bacterium]